MAFFWTVGFFLFISLRHTTCAENSTLPAPIVVPPSQYWEGDDGPWSTFQIRVGSPPQPVRVNAATNSPDQWVINALACPGGDATSQCSVARGVIFDKNTSTTWKDQGIFNLGLESNLNYSGTADYGLDTIGFGLSAGQGPGAISVDGQVVASLATAEFDFGVIGMNPQPTNFTNFANPIPSLFSSLKNQSLIPSLTWSYTAGAPYRLKKVLGQLIFGGSDTSRYIPNSVTFPFASDSTRDLVVAVQSITSVDNTGKTTELLASGGILAFVDSLIPYIYLPIDSCKEFENAFGLKWDNASELYLVSDSLHSSLTAQNASFSFVLGNSLSGGSSVTINLPYASFDLQANPPVPGLNTSSRYFPLKRSDNDSEYALGRAFLQEAYLIADYERQNFSISQAAFVDGAQELILPIYPVGYTPPGSSSGSASSSSAPPPTKSSIPTGAIVGIAVAGALILLLAIFLFFAYRNRKFPFHNLPPPVELPADESAELDEGKAGGVGGMEPPKYGENSELPAGADGHYAADGKYEMAAREGSAAELKGTSYAPNEMMGSQPANEMQGTPVFTELPAAEEVPVEYFGNMPPTGRRNGSGQSSPLSPLDGSNSNSRSRPSRQMSGLSGTRSPLSTVSSTSHETSTPYGAAAASAPSHAGRQNSGGYPNFLTSSSRGPVSNTMSPISPTDPPSRATSNSNTHPSRGNTLVSSPISDRAGTTGDISGPSSRSASRTRTDQARDISRTRSPWSNTSDYVDAPQVVNGEGGAGATARSSSYTDDASNIGRSHRGGFI